MEAPTTTYHESIRDEQVKVFRTIRPLSPHPLPTLVEMPPRSIQMLERILPAMHRLTRGRIDEPARIHQPALARDEPQLGIDALELAHPKEPDPLRPLPQIVWRYRREVRRGAHQGSFADPHPRARRTDVFPTTMAITTVPGMAAQAAARANRIPGFLRPTTAATTSRSSHHPSSAIPAAASTIHRGNGTPASLCAPATTTSQATARTATTRGGSSRRPRRGRLASTPRRRLARQAITAARATGPDLRRRARGLRLLEDEIAEGPGLAKYDPLALDVEDEVEELHAAERQPEVDELTAHPVIIEHVEHVVGDEPHEMGRSANTSSSARVAPLAAPLGIESRWYA